MAFIHFGKGNFLGDVKKKVTSKMDDLDDMERLLAVAFDTELLDDGYNDADNNDAISETELKNLGEYIGGKANISDKLNALLAVHNQIIGRPSEPLPSAWDNPKAQDIFMNIFAEPLESEIFYPIFEILHTLFLKNNNVDIEYLLNSELVERCAERIENASFEETSLILHSMTCIAIRCENYHTGILENIPPDLLSHIIEKDSSNLCDVASFVFKVTQKYNNEDLAPSFAEFCIEQINLMYDEDEKDFVDISELNNLLYSLYFCSRYMEDFSTNCYEIAPTLNKILMNGFGDLLYVGLLLISTMFLNQSPNFISIISQNPIIEYSQIVRLLRMPTSNLKGRSTWIPILAAHIVRSLLSCHKNTTKTASVDSAFDGIFSDTSEPLIDASDLVDAVPSIVEMITSGRVEKCVAALRLLKALMRNTQIVEPTKELDEALVMLLESDDEPILFHASEALLEFFLMLRRSGREELIGETALLSEDFGEVLEEAEGISDRVSEVISKVKSFLE